MDKKTICDECGGKMEEGFVPDSSYYVTVHPVWVKGKPEMSIWHGLKTKDKQAFYITTHRCENCGFLKFYADPNDKK